MQSIRKSMKPMLWPTVAVLLATLPANVRAQTPATPADDRAAMRQEMQELRRRLDELEQRMRIADANEARSQAAGSSATAATLPEPNPAGATPKSQPAVVTADTSGFSIQSADGDFRMKIGADLQVDNRTFTGKGAAALTDQMLVRRLRPTVSGTVYKFVDYYFRTDFGLGTTVVNEAYMQFNYFPHVNLRVGKFKPPVGLERLQSDDDTAFLERGLPTLLVPSRDIGYQLAGDLLENRISWQAGVFNGVPDNSLADASPSSHRDYAGRIFITPFAPNRRSLLAGLGAGLGASGGSVDGLALPAFKTMGQNTFFTFASGVIEAGHRTRLAPQAYYYLGPFGLLAEYGLTEEGLQKGTVRRDVAFRAWQGEATYLLTGERKNYGNLTPRRTFDPLHHGWGAVELALRTGEFSADHTITRYGFAVPTATPRSSREWVGGVNWYMNRIVRLSANYAVTSFEGGTPGGNRIAERVLLFRFQLNFI